MMKGRATNNYFTIRPKTDVEGRVERFVPGKHAVDPRTDGFVRVGAVVPLAAFAAKHLFFNDLREADTQRAFELASEAAKADPNLVVTIFRAALHPGPWDEVAVVGHRSLTEIRTEVAHALERLEASKGALRESWQKTAAALRAEREEVEQLFRKRRAEVLTDSDLD